MNSTDRQHSVSSYQFTPLGGFKLDIVRRLHLETCMQLCRLQVIFNPMHWIELNWVELSQVHRYDSLVFRWVRFLRSGNQQREYILFQYTGLIVTLFCCCCFCWLSTSVDVELLSFYYIFLLGSFGSFSFYFSNYRWLYSLFVFFLVDLLFEILCATSLETSFMLSNGNMGSDIDTDDFMCVCVCTVDPIWATNRNEWANKWSAYKTHTRMQRIRYKK